MLKVRPRGVGASTSLVPPYCYWTIFHWVERPHPVYPVIPWWAFGLFPRFGLYECWHGILRKHVFFFWMYLARSGIAGLYDDSRLNGDDPP